MKTVSKSIKLNEGWKHLAKWDRQGCFSNISEKVDSIYVLINLSLCQNLDFQVFLFHVVVYKYLNCWRTNFSNVLISLSFFFFFFQMCQDYNLYLLRKKARQIITSIFKLKARWKECSFVSYFLIPNNYGI